MLALAIILAGLALAGVVVPSGALVLALGCSWFAFLSWTRAYGYRTELGAATIALSLGGALLLLPLVFALAR